MKITGIALFALCAFLLQSFGFDESKVSISDLEAAAAIIEEKPETKEALESPTPNFSNMELELKLPLAKNNQTITESSETIERTTDDIISDYNFSKLSKNISEELDPLSNRHQTHERTEGERLLLDTIIGFIIEAALTCIVLIIVSALFGVTEATSRIAACSLIVALIGAALGFALRIDVLQPIRLILSFIILTPLIRFIVGIRRWPKVIQVSLITRVISLILMWIAYLGVSTVFGL